MDEHTGSHQRGGPVAPLFVNRDDSAPTRGTIRDVIVDQRPEVQQFYSRGAIQRPRCRIRARGARAVHEQRRSEPLAADADQTRASSAYPGIIVIQLCNHPRFDGALLIAPRALVEARGSARERNTGLCGPIRDISHRFLNAVYS
jgi:hypothetical protein